MEKFVDSDGWEYQCPEIVHDISCSFRVEFHTHRVLHPWIGHQYPKSRYGSAYCREPCRGQMESFADFVPAEKHDCDESRFHKKGHNSFYGKGSSENIAYEPAIIRPVRTELKFEDNTRCYSDCKIDSEKGHPILGNRFPPFVAGTVINGFHYTHDYSQSQCKGNK